MKLASISEAQYTTSEKGSLEWFLSSFFDLQDSDEMDPGEITKYYVPKDEFTVLLDDYPVGEMSVTKSPKGISAFYTGHNGHEIAGTDTDPRHDIVINMVKQVWPAT